MYECANCGMLPFACVCVPWCWEHDCPKQSCHERTHEPEQKSKSTPWIVVGLLLLSVVIVVISRFV